MGTYVEYKYKHKGQFADQDDFQFVELLKNVHKNDKAPKMLLVLDYMPKEDLTSGRLLSGATGKLLQRIVDLAVQFYKAKRSLDDFSWLAITYNSFRTAGKPEDFKQGAELEFEHRLKHIITKFKPDVVLTFGPGPYMALNKQKVQAVDNKEQHYYGVPIPTTVNDHLFLHVPTLSLNTLITCDGSGTQMYLAGYVARNVMNALNKRLTYSINPTFTPILIDTVKKFDRMLEILIRSKVVAVDTETSNLNRRKNKLLTIQFCADPKQAFFLPIYHKDSPFSGKELKYIKHRLREYFEQDNENDYQIYTNAVFDLTVMRNAFGIRYYKADVWDVLGASFAFDENYKVLQSVTGKNYYSLANLSMQYGTDIYYRIDFGKSKRTTIEKTDLTEGLIQYGCLDVVVPLLIHHQQLKQAKDIGYKAYQSVVRHQLSDMLHSFSTFEYNGVKTDIDYLFRLKAKDSPIVRDIDKIKHDLLATKGVQKANAILSTKSGTPKVGLFGKKTRNVFDISKKAHQELLFFDVLKLKPVSYGKSKQPKVDKEFQAKYADRKEVELFTSLSKAKKLYNAYVKSFIKQWGEDDDMRFDGKIRPHFSFLDVVTGRTSAKKPSLHQIPARSELGKHIKRLFITEPRRLLIKVDYSAHEVRGWAIISQDKLVADVFDIGLQLRNRFKLKPTPALLERIELEGDVHKINAAYFFGLPIEKVDKVVRNAVKAVIFGLIYQQGINGLAKNTKQTVEAITKLVKQFKARFPKGVQWFEDVQNFAKRNLYVESPIGRRRHLWGLIIPDTAQNAESAKAAMLRRAVNSPVQGFGSDCMMIGTRVIERLKWQHYKETGHYPDFLLCNSVHDSLEIDCAYEDIWLALTLIEYGLTKGVADVVKERSGTEFVIPLEIEFEIGANGRDVDKWDYSYESAYKLIEKALTFQKEELGHTIDPTKELNSIMSQYKTMPRWMKKQLTAANKIPDKYKTELSAKELAMLKLTIKEQKAFVPKSKQKEKKVA